MQNIKFLAIIAAVSLSACDNTPDHSPDVVAVTDTQYPEQVYWGDTHLHTANSVDAFGFGNRIDSEAALRFARGEQVTATKGATAKLSRPLDFLVIADHSDGIGVTKAIYDAPRIALLADKFLLRWHDMMHESDEGSRRVVAELIDGVAMGTLPPNLMGSESQTERTSELWLNHGEIIEAYNEPGKFTAFMGYEYTSMPDGNNLHRVVMFRDGPEKATRVLPFGSLQENEDPERLWEHMAAYEAMTGGQMLAIPHNSNLSNGKMFAMRRLDGSPIDAAYTRTRALREPLVEITQIKGDSESHPFLSPNDEFANYGDTGWDFCNLSCTVDMTPEDFSGSYTREALKRGLTLKAETGTNPFQFGVIGSTDSHTSLATADETNFFGKHTGNEANIEDRASQAQHLGTREGRFGWNYLASGYAAVWATSNTRAAIFDAMMRREVYATTGPRITLRMFAGFDFDAADTNNLVANGYARGVPMGGDLTGSEGRAPTFLISATMDPESAGLDRVQVIKGWLDASGEPQEKIYDVLWSNTASRSIDPDGKLTPAPNTVNLATGTWDKTSGTPELTGVWQDPDFNPDLDAFYYLRVLEIPTPTWPVYDALKFGLTLSEEVTRIQQERAYSSPIWYSPES